MSAIDEYLAEFERALKSRRARSSRLVAETSAHLRDASEELIASGLAPAAAEEQAIARFGRAADVAARFAEVSAAIAARRALRSAFGLTAGYLFLVLAFVTTAPATVHDLPQGLPSFVFLQVACLSCLVGAAAVAVGAVAAGAIGEAVIALSRPAGIVVWHDAPFLCMGLVVILLFAAAVALGGARVLVRRPERFAISPLAAVGAVALATVAQAVMNDAAHHVSGLAAALGAGVLEASAVAVSYVLLGRRSARGQRGHGCST